jgi:hypothetical protein
MIMKYEDIKMIHVLQNFFVDLPSFQLLLLSALYSSLRDVNMEYEI